MPAPTSVNATDGSFDDKIQVSWNAVIAPTGVSAVTSYKVYRATADVTNPNLAVLIATVAAPTVTMDDPIDDDLVVGSTYNFWVVATNGTNTSAFSSSDVGSAAAPTVTLDPVTDLRTTIGFGYGYIALVWTPPTGATKYDVYRGTTNVFADADEIYSDIVPVASTLSLPVESGLFVDNTGELLLYDIPTGGAPAYAVVPDVDFYYWVVAQKSSPPATSAESNSSIGRINAPAAYNLTNYELDWVTNTYVVPGGVTKMWAVLFPSGGGGAGANAVYGGGGGGGGGLVREAFTVAPGDVIDLIVTPSQEKTTNAAAAANGSPGALVELQINSVTKLTANAGSGGAFNSAGGGAGGAAATATGTTSPTIYAGKPGLAASGSAGGKSGYYFSGRRIPSATYHPSVNNNDSLAGAGASAWPANGSLPTGGSGLTGRSYLAFGA